VANARDTVETRAEREEHEDGAAEGPRGRESAEALKKDMQALTVSELRSVRARKAFSLVSGCGIRE